MKTLSPITCLLFVACCAPQSLAAEDIGLAAGAGSLELNLGSSAESRNIALYYYLPSGFSENSNIILVLPGSGRNAGDYRDSWIDSAEKYDLLVVSPEYPENEYDFAAYQLGGVVSELDLINPTIEQIDGRAYKYRMRDEDIKFSFTEDTGSFLFGDFDKTFAQVKQLITTNQQTYDLFGHSAGGQILHRYALFNPESDANRIVAANAGFYTLPSFGEAFPYGLRGTEVDSRQVEQAFSSNLILLLGEQDNQSATGGIMLHTPKADQQGLGRFARGQYFFEKSHAEAIEQDFEFNWSMSTVEGVGHNYRAMGEAAADLLYSR